MTKSPPPSRSPGRTAAAVSLALHAGAVLALWMIPARPRAAPETDDAIEVVLRGPERPPTFFTELPEDRADTPPEDPDFLSNVDSRARDDAPDGDESLPRSEGEATAPQVEIVQAEPAPDAAPPAPETSEPQPPAPESRPAPSPAADTGDPTPPAPVPVPRARPPEPETRLSVRQLAGLDIRQQAMRNPTGNAALSGDISLSTTAWEYAPWMQVFLRVVRERWLPPAAYHMGLIRGWVVARVEIARDGSLVGVTVLDHDVDNPSLTEAAVYALQAPAPYHKLPAGFPERTLSITIRFEYPARRGR